MAKKSTATKIVLDITSTLLHLFLNILFYIVVVMVVIKASQMAYQFSYEVFGSVSVSESEGKEYTLTISEGESTMNVATRLERNGIIVNRYSFYLRAKLTERKIFPGEYLINSSMDYDEIFNVIASANANVEEN